MVFSAFVVQLEVGRYLDLIQRLSIPNTVGFITGPATVREIEGPTDKGYAVTDLGRGGEERRGEERRGED